MLIFGDCLEEMNDIQDGSIDCCIADMPYGILEAEWDKHIPLELLWSHLGRVMKPNGAICLFGLEPFSSHLRLSNLKHFRYDWIWVKNFATAFANCNRRPLKRYEIISVFSREAPVYFPQGLKKCRKRRRVYRRTNYLAPRHFRGVVSESMGITNFPQNILYFNQKNQGETYNVTTKPIGLLQYFLLTYTKEGETVLDFCMGSGSTGVAAYNLHRKFIGIEKDQKNFRLAEDRINKRQLVFKFN